MSSDSEQVRELQAKRFAFLKFVYDHAQTVPDGVLNKVSPEAINEQLGLSFDEISRIGSYLKERHLVKFMTQGPTVAITAYGIDHVEAALAAPDKPTQYLPAINIL